MAQDSISSKTDVTPFVGLNLNNGALLPTNDFVKGLDNQSSVFTSLSLKYGYQSLGKNWMDYAFGMPYWGLGLNASYFYCKKELGFPITLFVFQGGTIHKINESLSLNYEWNLGMSFNWKPYDPFDNSENVAIGRSTNAYVAFIPHIKWSISNASDLKFGIGLSHFSNGAQKKPNKGLNLCSTFLEWDYTPENKSSVKHISPKIDYCLNRRFDYDFLVTVSSRQVEFDTLGTGLSSCYVDKNFTVLAMSFSPLFVPDYKYKYGLSFDMLYDESCGAKAWRQYNANDGLTYDRVALGNFWNRFSAGTSLKGEMTMPYYSIFANFGYNWLQGKTKDSRLYQIMGIKFYFKENMFATFGIRATRFSKASYLYWSLGYTFKGKPFVKCNPG
jgi:hypothetical protein